jgi:signal transduction histidine kinase
MTACRDAFVGLKTVKVFYVIICFLNVFWAMKLLGLNIDLIESFDGPMSYGMTTSFLIFIIMAKYSLEAYRSQKRNKNMISEFQQKGIIEIEKRKSMMTLIDMLAHETKNALSVISMTVSATDLGAERKNRIYRAISSLNSVIERCDQSVRLHNIDEKLKIQKCELSQIINNIIEDQIEKFRITVDKIAQPTVLADPVFLNVILHNLLENALKYSPAGSKVTITLDEQQGEAILTFENEQGKSGMPDPELVFQRHYRNERAQGISGSGLGLYICTRLAHAQNGNISYKPTENHIRFIVKFPCAI